MRRVADQLEEVDGSENRGLYVPAQDAKARRKRRNSTQRETSLKSSWPSSSMVVDDAQGW